MIELGGYIRDILSLTKRTGTSVFSDRMRMSNRLHKVFEAQNRDWNAEPGQRRLPGQNGRFMDPCFTSICARMAGRISSTGRHGFFAATRRLSVSLDSMAAQQMAEGLQSASWTADRFPELHLDFQCMAAGSQRIYPSDPGSWITSQIRRQRMYLPPDTNCLLSCFDHCIKSKTM